MKAIMKISAVIVLGLCLVGPAYAVPILDFDSGTGINNGVGGNGIVSVVAGGNVIGTNISLEVLTATGTGADGVYDLSGAGASQDANGAALLNFNTATGAISLVGGVPALSVANGDPLLSGTISSFTEGGDGAYMLIFQATGSDTKDPALLTALGVDPTTQFGFYSFTLGGNSNGTGSPYLATSVDIQNTGKTPEPVTLILYGVGFAGAGLYRRMRSKVKN